MSDEMRSPHNCSQLLSENDSWLRAVVYAHIRNSDAVDEVMQEIAIAVSKQIRNDSEIHRVQPWLRKIAVLQSLLFRRRAGRRRKLLKNYHQQFEQSENSFSEQTNDPLQWLLDDESRQQVRLALDQLAESDAEILILKYTQNWSYQQLSEHLGRSVSAIEARLFRARKKLRQLLASYQLQEGRSCKTPK